MSIGRCTQLSFVGHSEIHLYVRYVYQFLSRLAKKTGNTHISQNGGKYWEFPGNTVNSREILGFTGEFLNMTVIYSCI